MATQVLFVTGAGSGMGQLAARQALARGWKVAALDVNTEGLNALGDSPDLLKLVVDVCDAEAVSHAVGRTEAELGAIQRVFNAAAIMPLGLALSQPAALTQRIMAINYGGLVHVAQATLPRMLARNDGAFVSFCSLAGLIPAIYVGAYNASKFAVAAYTEVLYQENRSSKIRFACVCPPMVATPLLQQARNTVWPRLFSLIPPLAPEQVLIAIDKALARGTFWVLPGPLTRLSAWLRRFSPRLTWWIAHLVERR